MVDASEYLGLFLDESREHLRELNASLLDLERDSRSEEAIASTFRVAHSLKGMSATMGFEAMANLTHRMEEVLSLLRGAERPVTSAVVDLLFACLDTLEVIVEDIGEGGTGHADTGELLDRLGAVEGLDASRAEAAATLVDEPVRTPRGGSGSTPPTPSGEGFGVSGPHPSAPRKAPAVRVGTDKLDELMELAGEMLLQRSRLARVVGPDPHGQLGAAIDDVGRVANDLQALVMRIRMTPVDAVFQRFPRMVRDLGNALGKRIELVVTGGDTELDRAVVDELGDPLVHLLRNAADHGLESPAEREVAGKPPVGVIRLSAHHAGNSVVITVSEDGRGIDPERLRAAAVSRGLMDRDAAAALSEEDAVELIFRSGFSTAAETTAVSGRGVGMDAVRSKVRSLHGDMVIESVPGGGTTFAITLPLTLTLVTAQLVRSGQQVYAVPLDAIEETLVVHGEGTRPVHGRECIVLHGRPVPLVALHDGPRLAPGGDREGPLNVIVVRSGDRRLGVVADDLAGLQDVAVKHPSGHLGGVAGVTGATVLRDGSVALVVDVGALEVSGKVVGNG